MCLGIVDSGSGLGVLGEWRGGLAVCVDMPEELSRAFRGGGREGFAKCCPCLNLTALLRETRCEALPRHT